MATKHGLGRGLGALLQSSSPSDKSDTVAGRKVVMLPTADIRKSRWQPRHKFDDETIRELASSIEQHGILQPVLVRTVDDGYELMAGERRLRAAGIAGLETVPALVISGTDVEALELALVENLQREDLDPIEEAEGYNLLVKRFGLTQEQVSGRVGKARATVANALRLLSLPREARDLIGAGKISAGHGKVLTGLDIEREQILLARRVARESLSVRELERIVQKALRPPRKPRASRQDVPTDYVSHLSDRLHAHFGTGIRIVSCRTLANGKKAKGVLEIDFYSPDDLDRILAILGVTEEQ